MSIRARQIAAVLWLLVPLGAAVMLLPASTANVGAQAAVGPGMLGPITPARVDTVGAGKPTGGSASISLRPSGSQVLINSPWDCGSASSVRTINFSGGSGKFTVADRTNSFGELQRFTVTNMNKGSPTGFHYGETLASVTSASGDATLVDLNGDGAYDMINVGGAHGTSPVTFSLTFTFADVTGDGNPDYISIPWSLAGLVGVNTSDNCVVPGPVSDPPVWIPLADTNSDGKPDSIVLDLNGDGVADPAFFSSPPLVAPSVPAIGDRGFVLLSVLLGALGVWALCRRQTPPAAI